MSQGRQFMMYFQGVIPIQYDALLRDAFPAATVERKDNQHIYIHLPADAERMTLDEVRDIINGIIDKRRSALPIEERLFTL